MEAGQREGAWFAAHPERAAEQRARTEAAAAAREEAELQWFREAPPPGLDEYRDLSWRARLARGWLFITLGLTILSAALEIGHLNIVGDASTATADISLLQRIDESNATLATVYLLTLCSFVLCAVFFISWTYRAYKNGFALGARSPRFGAGWAVGGWFVPIMWLWRPKQIVDDIWRTSDPGDPPTVRSVDWRNRSVPVLVSAWWGFFVVSAFVDRISARTSTATVESDRTSTSWALVGSVLTIAAAVLAIWVVTRLTNRQRERAAAVQELAASGSPSGSPQTAATAPAT
jgi:hypothetical protein